MRKSSKYLAKGDTGKSVMMERSSATTDKRLQRRHYGALKQHFKLKKTGKGT
jgi:hypothetical protein